MVHLRWLLIHILFLVIISEKFSYASGNLEEKAFAVPVEITNRNFTIALRNRESPEYQSMYNEVSDLFNSVYGCSNTYLCPSTYAGVVSMTFRSGSVIANTTILFTTNIINHNVVYGYFVQNFNKYAPSILQLNKDYTTLNSIKPVVPTTSTTTTTKSTTITITSTTTPLPTTTTTTSVATTLPSTTSTPTTTTTRAHSTISTTTPTTTTTISTTLPSTTTTPPTTTTTAHTAISTTTPTTTTSATTILPSTAITPTTNPTTTLAILPTATKTESTTLHITTPIVHTTNSTTFTPTTKTTRTTARATKLVTTITTAPATTTAPISPALTSATAITTAPVKNSTTASSSRTNTSADYTGLVSTTMKTPGNHGDNYTTGGSETHDPMNFTTAVSPHDKHTDPQDVSSGKPYEPPTSAGGSSYVSTDWVPGWGIALLVLAATTLLVLIIILILMLVQWCSRKRESGEMDRPEDPYYLGEKQPPPQEHLPEYSPQTPVTQKPESIPVIKDTPKKNRTGFYSVNP